MMEKKLNTNSNVYIIVYATILVIVVAFMLAFVYQVLKPMSDENVRTDKKKQILAALNLRSFESDDEIKAKYNEVVVADEIINKNAEVVDKGEGKDQSAFKGVEGDDQLAVYICNVGGQTKYVIPMTGKGLWGPVWGYIAVNEDKQTVFGAYFNHEGETAGLGALIADEPFQDEFQGKKLSKDGKVLSVVKFGNVKDAEVECDGISGATKTCNGVRDMIAESLNNYSVFLTK